MGIVGDRLKQLRTDKRLYPSEVAKFPKITRPAYLKYENGQTEHPRKLDELAAFLGVSTIVVAINNNLPKDEQNIYLQVIFSMLRLKQR